MHRNQQTVNLFIAISRYCDIQGRVNQEPADYFLMKPQIFFIVWTGCTFFLAACGRPPSAPSPDSSGPSVAVQVVPAKREAHQAVEEVVGTVRSKQRAVIEAKVSGRVLQFLVVPGQVVKAGETLAELDVRELQARRAQAAARLEQANREMARSQKLVAGNVTSRQEHEAVDAAQKVARAALHEVETLLSYARVTAPFAGVITRKLAEVGDLAMPGKPLMEIEAHGSLRFEADVPEAILDRIEFGDQMSVRIASVAQPFEGRVSEIAPVADAVSRTFQVKLDLPDAKELRAGQFGRLAVPVAETKLLSVPRTSVLKRGQMEMVFVVREETATLRLVKTGKVLGERVEILSGLEEGEPVVVGDISALKDGQPVTLAP